MLTSARFACRRARLTAPVAVIAAALALLLLGPANVTRAATDPAPTVFAVPPAGGAAQGFAGTDDPEALVAAQPFEVLSVSTFDVPTQRYHIYVPGAPAAVNALARSRLHEDSIVWLVRKPTDTARRISPPSAVSGTASGRRTAVFRVPVSGGATQGLAGVSEPERLVDALPFDVTSVSMFDFEEQRFLVYVPGAPGVVNTLSAAELDADCIVWIRRRAADRGVPAGGLVSIPPQPSSSFGAPGQPGGAAGFGPSPAPPSPAVAGFFAPPPAPTAPPVSAAPPPPPTTPTPTPSPVPAPQSSDSFFVSANLPAKFWGGVGYSDFGSGAIRQAESELRARLAEAQAAGMSGPVRTWFAPGNGLVSPPTPPWQYESSATVAQTVSDLLWYADLLEEFGFQLLPTLYAMPGQYRPEHMPQINAILQGIAGRTWAVDIVNEPEWTVDPSSWRTVAQTLVDAVHNAGHRATVEHARLSDVSRWPDVGFDLRMVSSYPHLGAGNWVGSWSPPDVGVPMYVGEFWLGGSINLPWAGTLTPEQALSDIRDRGWSGVLLWPLLPGVTGETQADLAAVGRFTAGGTSSSSSGAAGSGGFRVANVVQPETIPPGTDLTVQVTLLADSQGVQGGHFLPIIWAKGITAPDSAWRELGSPLGEASGAGGIAVNLAPNERTTITLVFPLSTWGVADGEMVGWNDHWPNQWWNSPQTRIVQGRAP